MSEDVVKYERSDIEATRPEKSLVDKVQEIAAATAHLVEFKKKAVETAIALTGPGDWSDLGGKPYLQETGANRAASVLPIEVWCIEKPCKQWIDDETGRSYIYTCEYGAKWKGGLGEITATGTASSKDKFFSMRAGVRMPTSEVDEPNIIKKCATNGRRNAIARLLGMQAPTWEELERAGIKRSACQKVDYDGKGKGSATKTDENPEEANKTRERIKFLLLQLNEGSTDAAASHLEALTTFTGKDGNTVKGKNRVQYLSEKQATVTLQKLEKEYEEWAAKQEQG